MGMSRLEQSAESGLLPASATRLAKDSPLCDVTPDTRHDLTHAYGGFASRHTLAKTENRKTSNLFLATLITTVTKLWPRSCVKIDSTGMPNKRKTKKEADTEDELWVAPRSSFRGADGGRGWGDHITRPPNSSRFLEMADIALGLKKPTPKKTKSKSVHQTTKSEPYSS